MQRGRRGETPFLLACGARVMPCIVKKEYECFTCMCLERRVLGYDSGGPACIVEGVMLGAVEMLNMLSFAAGGRYSSIPYSRKATRG